MHPIPCLKELDSTLQFIMTKFRTGAEHSNLRTVAHGMGETFLEFCLFSVTRFMEYSHRTYENISHKNFKNKMWREESALRYPWSFRKITTSGNNCYSFFIHEGNQPNHGILFRVAVTIWLPSIWVASRHWKKQIIWCKRSISERQNSRRGCHQILQFFDTSVRTICQKANFSWCGIASTWRPWPRGMKW